MNKKFIFFFVFTIVYFILGLIIWTTFDIGYNWILYPFFIITFSVYLFKDKKNLFLKAFIILLLILSSGLYMLLTYKQFFATGVSYGGGLKVDTYIGILGYLFTILAFLYFSFHSFELYKEKSKVWTFDLIFSILILIAGYIFSVRGFGYGAISIFFLTILIFIVISIILLIKFLKYRQTI